MSIELMSGVWKMDLPTFEKLVLLALADCANDEGLCWPSIATLERKTNAGRRTVQRSIRALESAGILKRQEVPGKGCKYYITLRQTDTGAGKSPVPESAPTGATVAPKPSRTTSNKRASAIPDNWKPEPFAVGTKSHQAMASWSADDLAAQIEHFTAHHRGKGSKFVDWQSAWATWVLNSRKWGVKPAATRFPANDAAGSFLDFAIQRQRREEEFRSRQGHGP